MNLKLLAPALLLGGCVSHVAPPPLASNHPANPDAVTSPLPPVSQSLASYEPIAAAELRPPMDHGAMDHGSMEKGNAESKPDMDHKSMGHGAMKESEHGALNHNETKAGDSMAKPGKSSDSARSKPSMQGMDHGAMDHGTMKGMDHGAHWMAPEAAAARKNPMKADKASTSRGEALFQQNCAACHGVKGRGDGPAGAALDPKPVDLAAMAGEHPDGDFAWKIENGRGAMPAWKGVLTQNQIWDVVNYTKSLGGGSAKSGEGKRGGDHDHSKHKH
ncbi:MAG: c-type cytochrome [Pseudomonadota bacterium]|nr:c-type cytochrome [Pseudomonadota bacterium]